MSIPIFFDHSKITSSIIGLPTATVICMLHLQIKKHKTKPPSLLSISRSVIHRQLQLKAELNQFSRSSPDTTHKTQSRVEKGFQSDFGWKFNHFKILINYKFYGGRLLVQLLLGKQHPKFVGPSVWHLILHCILSYSCYQVHIKIFCSEKYRDKL